MDEENLNEFLKKKCFVEVPETHPDILRGARGTHTDWKMQQKVVGQFFAYITWAK